MTAVHLKIPVVAELFPFAPFGPLRHHNKRSRQGPHCTLLMLINSLFVVVPSFCLSFPCVPPILTACRAGSCIDGSVHYCRLTVDGCEQTSVCAPIQSEELLITEGLQGHQAVRPRGSGSRASHHVISDPLRIKVGIGIIASQEMAKRYMNFYTYLGEKGRVHL